jgi:hypothetical protein
MGSKRNLLSHIHNHQLRCVLYIFCYTNSANMMYQTYKQDSKFNTEYQNLVVNNHALFFQQLNNIQYQT